MQTWGPTPSERQRNWHELEFYGFIHFTTNTFTDKEWGYGDESPAIVNPSDLDCNQWAQVAADAGMKGLILTAKHHDGFCLWPSAHASHSIMSSPWKDGKGDLVKEFTDACRNKGLKVGLYLSPWDRNRSDYGTASYVDYYRKQLMELVTGYGELFEFWFDGANGGDGFYGGACEMRRLPSSDYYDFTSLWSIVRQYQPQAVIFSDAGPDIRWVGNENGYAPDTCWCKVKGDEPVIIGQADVKTLASGSPDGSVWRPAEVDVSIRNGWFYHSNEKPKSPDELMEIYMNSVGRGCCLLLNLPPDRRGLIPEADIVSLREWKRRLDEMYKHELPSTIESVPDSQGNMTVLTADTGSVQPIGLIRIEEAIELGQRIESFTLEARVSGVWSEVGRGGTIGPRRLMHLDSRPNAVYADAIRLSVKAQAPPHVSKLAIYKAAVE